MPTTYLSDQLTKVDGTSASYAPQQPNEYIGRVRVSYFNKAIPTGFADGDSIALQEVPAGARILGGNIAWGALGTSVVGQVGITGDLDRYLTASTAMASAGTAHLANTLALNIGEEVSVVTRLLLTLSGAAAAAGQVIRGYVLFVVD